MKILSSTAAAAALICALVSSPAAFAQASDSDITVTDAWARATVAQQKATGAFMHLRSVAGGKIVEVRSAAAGIAEVHEMKLDGDIMKMRPIDALPLPAGQTVELKPGGYHVMLMQLKQQLKTGDTLPLTLVVEGADGKRRDVDVKVPVKALDTSAMPADHSQMHMHMNTK